MNKSSGNRKQFARRPILVTGAHRTGTTWVGKMLAASRQVGYISEPMNILHRPGILITPTHFWYTYICAENEDLFLPGFSKTLAYRYNFTAEIKSLKSLRDWGRMGRDVISFFVSSTLNHRPLLKDPFAFFSAPWFADQFGCEVVITIRHPAAFVSSLKRLRWPFDLGDLLKQPQLMRDLLEPFRTELETIGSDPTDEIGNNSVLWKIIYLVARDFESKYPQFHMVRHEDLSLKPIEGFESLYRSLDLGFNAHAFQKIQTSTNAENPKELSSNSAHSIQLNSKANLENWKHRLTKTEISRIRELTGEVVEMYYPDIDWD